ncbi:MAG: hypothetical protein M1814_002240 [Vezdaea aestivalis]|nr:MAG: hypothetical protein M1814_002240 [Vezdaea aestivalis]
MDDQTAAETFANRSDPIPVLVVSGSEDGTTGSSDPDRPSSGKRPRSLSRSRLKEKLQDVSDKKAAAGSTSLQDRLFSKLLQQIIPSDADDIFDSPDKRSTTYINRPGFSLPLMTNNFRRFNARIGVVFIFQTRLIRLLTWVEPTHTLSLLAIYTFLTLSPTLLSILPPAVILLFIMVPAFMIRHPPPPLTLPTDVASYSLHGPALSDPPTVRPAPEMSKDFFRNLRDLQNCMADFSTLHDQTVALLAPPTNFSDEVLSSSLFLLLTFITAVLFVGAHLVPYRFIFVVAGWSALLSLHPTVQKSIQKAHKNHIKPRQEDLWTHIRNYISLDIMLDLDTEEREVETFELQRQSRGDEWEAWVFGPSPHDPLSAERIAGGRPKGTRFFEDVQPPQGWAWRDKKWMLDLNSREWVEERMITGVEIEVEGERWVVDASESAKEDVGGGHWDGTGTGEGVVFRRGGEWRRRRWVRTVHRRSMEQSGEK